MYAAGTTWAGLKRWGLAQARSTLLRAQRQGLGAQVGLGAATVVGATLVAYLCLRVGSVEKDSLSDDDDDEEDRPSSSSYL